MPKETKLQQHLQSAEGGEGGEGAIPVARRNAHTKSSQCASNSITQAAGVLDPSLPCVTHPLQLCLLALQQPFQLHHLHCHTCHCCIAALAAKQCDILFSKTCRTTVAGGERDADCLPSKRWVFVCVRCFLLRTNSVSISSD